MIAGGAINGFGMFNALVLSYTRLPMAMAEDGMLPGIFALRNRRDVPWVSVLLCGAAWAAALSLPFERLISIDLVLYGSSLLLEFVALAVLRVREPELKRPFKAGNLMVACLLGVAPLLLILLCALRRARRKGRLHLCAAVGCGCGPDGSRSLFSYGLSAMVWSIRRSKAGIARSRLKASTNGWAKRSPGRSA